MPPRFWAWATTDRASVVLPDDSGPKISTTRPHGRPPMPMAWSIEIEPVEMDSIANVSRCPSRMIEPLPNWRSIWVRAVSTAFSRSDRGSAMNVRSYGRQGWPAPVVGWSSRTDLPCTLVLAWDLLRGGKAPVTVTLGAETVGSGTGHPSEADPGAPILEDGKRSVHRDPARIRASRRLVPVSPVPPHFRPLVYSLPVRRAMALAARQPVPPLPLAHLGLANLGPASPPRRPGGRRLLQRQTPRPTSGRARRRHRRRSCRASSTTCTAGSGDNPPASPPSSPGGRAR